MPEVIHVFSEQDSKGSLLAEVNRLHNCLVVSSDELAAMRQARDFHGANSAYLMQGRGRLQAKVEGIRGAYDRASQSLHDTGLELAQMKEWKRRYFDLERGHSATVDKLSDAIERIQLRERELSERSDLKVKAEAERDRLQREIEEMSKLREEAPALDGQWHSPSVVTTGNLDHLKMQEAPAPVDAGLVERMLIAWGHGDGDIKLDAINVRRMTAALRVAADALLGPVTDEEAKDWSRDDWGVRYLYQSGVNELLAARRARLLAPAATEPKP